MVPGEVFRKLGKLGMTFFSFLSGKEEGHTTASGRCSYCPDTNLAQQQGAVGEDWTGSSGTITPQTSALCLPCQRQNGEKTSSGILGYCPHA